MKEIYSWEDQVKLWTTSDPYHDLASIVCKVLDTWESQVIPPELIDRMNIHWRQRVQFPPSELRANDILYGNL